MKKLKQIGFAVLFLLLVVTLRPASAQAPTEAATIPGTSTMPAASTLPNSTTTTAPTTNNDPLYSNTNPDVPKNLKTLTQSTMLELLASSVCMVTGRDIMDPNGTGKGCLGFDPSSGKIGYVKSENGIAQVMGGLIGGTMSIPVSSSDYATYAVNNFGLTKSAYAQANGLGYTKLSPLINVWATFRNIAYLLFVLAFTIIGLAIMLRIKIDARTVMTIQNQIPKIVIALVLVTFSYAIAGFLIDVMYILIYLFIFTFSSLVPTNINADANIFTVFNKVFAPNTPGAIDNLANNFSPIGTPLVYNAATSGIMGLAFSTSKGLGGAFTSLTSDFLSSTIAELFRIPFTPFSVLNVGCNVAEKISFGLINNCVDFQETMFRTFFTFLFGTIVFLVVIVALIFSLFRVWFTLIKSFIYVLIDTMVAPLWITVGIFPGSKLNFSSWIKHLMGHLSVFPMAFGVILLGKAIMSGIATSSNQLFSPPLIGGSLGGNTALAAFVGFGFIISMPSILDRTRKAVGAVDFGLTDIKRGFGAGRTAGSVGMNTAFGQYTHVGQDGKLEAVQGPKKLIKALGIMH